MLLIPAVAAVELAEPVQHANRLPALPVIPDGVAFIVEDQIAFWRAGSAANFDNFLQLRGQGDVYGW